MSILAVSGCELLPIAITNLLLTKIPVGESVALFHSRSIISSDPRRTSAQKQYAKKTTLKTDSLSRGYVAVIFCTKGLHERAEERMNRWDKLHGHGLAAPFHGGLDPC